MALVWAANGNWGRRWQWKPCRPQRGDCSREFCSKVTRSVICWQQLCIGSCFRCSAGAVCLSQERFRRFLCSTSGHACQNHLCGCASSTRWRIFGTRRCSWSNNTGRFLCAASGILLIPLWVFSPGFTLLVIGGFAMQFMVQGAWGIVPVHLNELSPGAVRGTFPGFAYQLGNLFAANTAVVEAQLANHFRGASGHPDYAKALALFTFVIFLALILLAAIGSEKRGKEF